MGSAVVAKQALQDGAYETCVRRSESLSFILVLRGAHTAAAAYCAIDRLSGVDGGDSRHLFGPALEKNRQFDDGQRTTPKASSTLNCHPSRTAPYTAYCAIGWSIGVDGGDSSSEKCDDGERTTPQVGSTSTCPRLPNSNLRSHCQISDTTLLSKPPYNDTQRCSPSFAPFPRQRGCRPHLIPFPIAASPSPSL